VLRANGWPSNEHRLRLANILILPLLAVAMMLLAVPFGLRNSRTQSVIVSIGLGLLLGFSFFALRNWVGAYAVAGRLEPLLAACVPVAIGLILAFFLLVWLREE
jgi:lipopolysaccharide export LptBFGC system permease protein LptF